MPERLIPAWAGHWVSSLLQTDIDSCTQVCSNKINQVFRLEAAGNGFFLKIGPDLDREYRRSQWLIGRLPCPRPVGFTSHDGIDVLLMSAVIGVDLAVSCASVSPLIIITRLVKALKTVHATDITEWPFGGEGRVLIHGDACLPNFLYRGENLSGCIDLGDMTIGDPETDLAAAVWTLQYNLGLGHGLRFLSGYGFPKPTERDVERLRMKYETE